MELDHIVPAAEGGSDDIDNAIPLCFECHAEAHSYNDQHPRGRKFQPDELRLHRDNWLRICSDRPEILVSQSTRSDVGPLQALVDELDFNLAVFDLAYRRVGDCNFLDEQFRRAVAAGAISVLEPSLKKAILEAYVMARGMNEARGHRIPSETIQQGAILERLQATHDALLKFLASEGTSSQATVK